ncbi:substrate-binding periplasmic protein [Maridesulfovibrio sp.]|uniref:substrate-binding periplasmic protein n=1 Tax=Maridesulfovibrio sp. TaxID=2795000 RepID=UPI003BAA9DC1
MRINFKYLLKNIFLLCAICMIPEPILHAKEAPMIITYSDFWPLFKTEQNGTMSGIFYEIVSEAMTRIDVKIKWESYPWARCQNYVKTGKADGIMTVPTNERAEYTVTHPTPFYHQHLQLFTYKDNSKEKFIDMVKTPEDIQRAELSVITYVGNGWNKDNIQSLGIITHEASNPETIWPMLSHKRGDIVIEWPIAAWLEIKSLNLSQKIVQTNGTVDSIPFHLLFSKKSNYIKILPRFEKAIQEMKNDGTIKSIIKKYKQLVLKNK